MAVLSAVIHHGNKAFRAVGSLTVGHFSAKTRRLLWRVVCELTEAAETADLDQVLAITISQDSEVQRVLGELTDYLCNAPSDWRWHAGRLRERLARERVYELGREIAEGAADPASDFDQQTRDLGNRVVEILDTAVVKPTTSNVLAEYIAAAQLGAGLNLGFGAIDTIFGGIQPGEVLTVIARPGVGKSAFGTQVLVNLASSGIAGCFWSYEMPSAQAFERMIVQSSGLPTREVRGWAKSGCPPESVTLDRWSRRVMDNVTIHAPASRDIKAFPQMLADATAILKRRPRLVIIDYLQLLDHPGSRTNYERMSRIAIEVKTFAKRNDVAVMLLCQASRHPQGNEEYNAGAVSLGATAARDSGQIGEAADFMLTLCRPALTRKPIPEYERSLDTRMLVSVVKNRRGPLGEAALRFEGEMYRVIG